MAKMMTVSAHAHKKNTPVRIAIILAVIALVAVLWNVFSDARSTLEVDKK